MKVVARHGNARRTLGDADSLAAINRMIAREFPLVRAENIIIESARCSDPRNTDGCTALQLEISHKSGL